MKISVVVPVYKEPEMLEDIFIKVSSYDYEEKELVIVVDGNTNLAIEEVVKKVEGCRWVKVVYNNARLGKVESLNRVVDFCDGEGIIFLDNDVELPYDVNFLKKVSYELGRYDIVEFAKEGIGINFFSKVVSYDYLGGAIASWLSSKVFGRNLFLCGSAFAIRKNTFLELGRFPKVINEDWSLMLKTFGKDKKFSYNTELKVKTYVPMNLYEWIEQRKRWSLGMRVWWIELFKKFWLFLKSLKVLGVVGVVMSMPIILSLLVSLLISDVSISMTYLNVLMLFANYFGLNFNFSLTGYVLTFLLIGSRGLLPLIVMFGANFLLFFTFSKLFGFRFNFVEFVFYVLFYYPFLVGFYLLYGWIVSFIFKPKIDWVVSNSG